MGVARSPVGSHRTPGVIRRPSSRSWSVFSESVSHEILGLLRVTNGSYGDDEKGDHSYRVNVENGIPVACGARPIPTTMVPDLTNSIRPTEVAE